MGLLGILCCSSKRRQRYTPSGAIEYPCDPHNRFDAYGYAYPPSQPVKVHTKQLPAKIVPVYKLAKIEEEVTDFDQIMPANGKRKDAGSAPRYSMDQTSKQHVTGITDSVSKMVEKTFESTKSPNRASEAIHEDTAPIVKSNMLVQETIIKAEPREEALSEIALPPSSPPTVKLESDQPQPTTPRAIKPKHQRRRDSYGLSPPTSPPHNKQLVKQESGSRDSSPSRTLSPQPLLFAAGNNSVLPTYPAVLTPASTPSSTPTKGPDAKTAIVKAEPPSPQRIDRRTFAAGKCPSCSEPNIICYVQNKPDSINVGRPYRVCSESCSPFNGFADNRGLSSGLYCDCEKPAKLRLVLKNKRDHMGMRGAFYSCQFKDCGKWVEYVDELSNTQLTDQVVREMVRLQEI